MSSAESPAPLRRTSAVVTIAATVVGTILAYLSLAAAVKWPPFQDGAKPTVTVFRGDPPQDPRCPGSSCANVGVQLAGFAPGSTVRCTFDSAGGPGAFGPYVATVDEDGYHRGQSTNFYGTPQGWVSATCGEATGALNPWGDS
ncbi:hypothetical protein ACFQO7_26155 [Catellatospora aurea]|uniref:Subtilisin inhibitor-like n=1 Tax=Catellatospora aurea TaxID=1337874 RepID=A0ABW2H5T0_9ACTN